MEESAAEQNQMDQSQASSPVDKLLKIAGEAQDLAFPISGESEKYRTAGRLGRLARLSPSELTERERAFLAASLIDFIAMVNDECPEHLPNFRLLQGTLADASHFIWETLWNEKHPDRLGSAWEGEDFELMDVWRERVRTMISKCGQDKVFSLTAEQYAAELISAGANEALVEDLVSWMSDVLYQGTTPSS